MPWGEMLRAALRLGIGPRAFWRLSVREWRMLAGAPDAGGLDRAELSALMTRFPDTRDPDTTHKE